ncbi:MAG: GIY-YIG nuclease family protein [Candidatus Omnitrophica bacterium]|nr:GIY-YIG nuclease family protein [Candidatus Omnitrophota bacterium]
MFVYVLRSKKDKSLYIGSTKNVDQRFNSHNRGESLSTKSKRPWVLTRVEEYNSDSLALKREKFLKSGEGRRVLKNLTLFK